MYSFFIDVNYPLFSGGFNNKKRITNDVMAFDGNSWTKVATLGFKTSDAGAVAVDLNTSEWEKFCN